DVRDRPLMERKKLLRKLLGRRPGVVRYLDHVAGRGRDLFAAVCEQDLEGIVAKERRGPSAPGGGESKKRESTPRRRGRGLFARDGARAPHASPETKDPAGHGARSVQARLLFRWT